MQRAVRVCACVHACMHEAPVVPARSGAASSLHTHRNFRKGDGSRRGADEGQCVPPLPHELQGRICLGEPLPIGFEAGVGEAAIFVGSDLEQNPVMGARGRDVNATGPGTSPLIGTPR